MKVFLEILKSPSRITVFLRKKTVLDGDAKAIGLVKKLSFLGLPNDHHP